MENTGELLGLSAEAWNALGTWATALVATVAGLLALNQLRETRKQRMEASQPYVAVALRPSEVDPSIADLVVRNFGATAAFDIDFEMDPKPERHSSGGAEAVWIPDRISTLVPGQEWSTWWDSGYQRFESSLPRKSKATVSYRDSHGQDFKFEYSLDWTPYLNAGRVVAYGPHHSAKALRSIEKLLKGWTRDTAQGSLSVLVRDGDRRDAKRREAMEAREEDESGGTTG
ncbi:MAG TPA: hypothetical protein PKD76_10310 [Solirubrobacterales bacterium]|nr:hypothetical protein [Solirubrobacterales bacterium]